MMCETKYSNDSYRVVTRDEEEKFSDINIGERLSDVVRERFSDCPHVGKQKTPYWLCKQIVDKLPDLSNKLVLVLFTPEFYLAALNKYPEAKFVLVTGSKKVSNMRLKNVKYIIEANPFDSTCLDGITKMKFDVVIGNPPYQAPHQTSENKKAHHHGAGLWTSFVEKSFDICLENGYISFIHPPQWRAPGSKLFPEFQKRNLLYAEFHDSDAGIKTFGASTRYDWYILQNSSNKGAGLIKDLDGVETQVTLDMWPFLPNSKLDVIRRLLPNSGEDRCRILYSTVYHGGNKSRMSPVKTEEFKYPCVHSILQNDKGYSVRYSNDNTKGLFGVPKVIISQFVNNGVKTPIVDIEGRLGMTQVPFAIPVKTYEEALEIKKAVTSENFIEVIRALKLGYFSISAKTWSYFRKDFWKEFV